MPTPPPTDSNPIAVWGWLASLRRPRPRSASLARCSRAVCSRAGWDGRRAVNSTETTPWSASGAWMAIGKPSSAARARWACRDRAGWCAAKWWPNRGVRGEGVQVDRPRREAVEQDGEPVEVEGVAVRWSPRSTVSAYSICRTATSATVRWPSSAVQPAFAQVVGAFPVVEGAGGVDGGDVGVDPHRVGHRAPSMRQCAQASATASGSTAGGRTSTMSHPGRSRASRTRGGEHIFAGCTTRIRAPARP